METSNVHPFQESHPYTVGPYTFVRLSDGEGGTCSHCGRPLRNLCHIEDSLGHRFIVGTSCVLKTRDERIGTPMEVKLKELQRKKRQEKRRKEIEARVKEKAEQEEKYQNEILPSGRTRKEEAEFQKKVTEEKFNEKWGEMMEVLDNTYGMFALSVLDDLYLLREPRGKGLTICCEIYAKTKGGRKGSKAYNEALAYITKKLECA